MNPTQLLNQAHALFQGDMARLRDRTPRPGSWSVPIDILVEGRLVARGELLVIEKELAVRIVELI